MAGGDGMRAFDSAAIFRGNMQTAGDAKEYASKIWAGMLALLGALIALKK
jgi:hypothetical protein